MTRITLARARELAARGQVSAEDLDRFETPHRSLADACAPAIFIVELAEPIEFNVPIDLQTENALRAQHPIHRRRREKKERGTLMMCWNIHFRRTRPQLPVIVTWTRFGRHTDSHDSLAAAFKHLTDEVTELLGLKNDDTKEVVWRYQQEPRGTGNERKIRIRVEAP